MLRYFCFFFGVLFALSSLLLGLACLEATLAVDRIALIYFMAMAISGLMSGLLVAIASGDLS